MTTRRALTEEEYEKTIDGLEYIISQCEIAVKHSFNIRDGNLLRIKETAEELKELVQ